MRTVSFPELFSKIQIIHSKYVTENIKKKITEQQVRVYMISRKRGKTQKIAAAQTGFCERSAYNIEKRDFTAAKTVHNWRTRKDPFESIWEN